MRRALTEAFKKQLDRTPEFQVKSLKDLTHSEYMEHWKRFADRSERAQEELRKVFHGINKKQRRGRARQSARGDWRHQSAR